MCKYILRFFRTGGSFLIVTVAVMLVASPASAYVYDDFSGSGYGAKWTDIGPNTGLFSQPGDGYLYFNDPANGGHQDRLKSTTTFSGALFVSLQYEFISVSNTATGAGQGSSVSVVLSDGLSSPNAVAVWEYYEGGLAHQYGFNGGQTVAGNSTGTVPNRTTNVTSGWLGIEYNGLLGTAGQVILKYDDGTGWQQLGTFTGTNFANNPYVIIRGHDLYGTSLSFKVNEVGINPVPIPPALWLFGPGLVGLAAVRRRFIK